MSHSSAANGRAPKNSSSPATAQIASREAARDALPHREDEAATAEKFMSPLSQLSPTIYVSLPGSPTVAGTAPSSQGNTKGPEEGHAPTPAVYERHESAQLPAQKESLQTPPKANNTPCDSLPQTQPFATKDSWDSSSSPENWQRKGWRITPGGTEPSVVVTSSPSSRSSPSLPSVLAKKGPPTAPELHTSSIRSSLTGSPTPNRRSSKVSWQPDNVLSTPVSTREAWANTTRSKETEPRTGSTVDGQRGTLLAYIAMVLIVLAFCVVLTIVLLVTVPPGTPQIICTSTPCAALDALLEDSVDRAKDPCSDFYAYVCHGWAHSRNVSVYRSHVQRFLAEIDVILGHVNVHAQGEQKSEQAVVAVYQTCMAVLAGGADELPAFREHLQRVGVSWPNVSPQPNLVLTAVKVYAHFGIAAVLRIRRLIKSAASDMLEVAPDEGFQGTWKKTRERLLVNGVYKRFFEETRNIYSGNNSGDPALEVLRYSQFVNIEKYILTGLAPEKLSNNITFLRSVDSLATVTKNIDEASWRAAAKILRISNLAQVYVRDLDYVKRVDKVMKAVGPQHLHYYAGWCVVQLMRRYMNKALAKNWYDYEDITSMMFESEKQRSQADCVQFVESLVGPLTFRRFMLWSGNSSQSKFLSMRALISKQLKEKVTQAQIYGAAERDLHASDYGVDLTEDTLKALDEAFGSKWNLSNSSSLLSNWMDVAAAVSTVNATFRDLISSAYVKELVAKEQYSLFDERKGAVSLPPMYAMLPVYDQHLSDAANFGALGTLLATASLRAFLARLPAETTAYDEALRKLGCFANAVENSSDKLELYHPAASVGIALDALRHLPDPDRLRLQLFNKLQTFFVLMCYLLCTHHTSEKSEYAQVTCNEAVKNSAYFPDAFKCPSGSPMNPAKRCDFF